MSFIFHEQLLDNLPDGITVQDKDFNIIYQNKAMKAAFGNHVGQKCFTIYEKRDRICEGCGLQRVFQNRNPYTVLRTAFEADGTTSYWENVCFPLLTSEGSIIAGVENCRNVTHRVSLEEDVKDRNIQLGQMNKELMQKTDQLRHALAQREIAEQKLRFEMDEREAVQAALRESEDKYRTHFEQLRDAMFVTDVETGILVDCNQAALDLIGRTKSEVVGKHQRILHPPEEGGSEFTSTFRQYCKQDGKQTIETQVITASGKTRDVSITCSMFKLKGRMLLQGAFRDITKLKKAEAELAQARKLESIGQLAAGIAHEINTPTQYVNDNTRFLQEALGDYQRLLEAYEQALQGAANGEGIEERIQAVANLAEEIDLAYLLEEVPQAINQSLEGLERIAKIVRAMKEFSHPGTEEKTLIDLNHAIHSTIDVSRNEWKYHADIKTDLDPELPAVSCLPGELNQVFLNLIVNAAHAIAERVNASAEKGVIGIATRRDADWVEISISDTGSGIPEPIRERIFDPFFTTKEVGKGTGQGLAIVWSTVVDKHGGTINVASEPGEGSTFTIRLPLTQDTKN